MRASVFSTVAGGTSTIVGRDSGVIEKSVKALRGVVSAQLYGQGSRYNDTLSHRESPIMNAPLTASLFATVDLAPKDPILGVTEIFNADANPNKVNLGVGVYCDDTGKLPLLDCVKSAERAMTDKATPRGYLPI